MKVKEVIEYLQQFNPDSDVFILPQNDPFNLLHKGAYLYVDEDNKKEQPDD